MGKLEAKLDGKIALITGGSSGIGLATARRFVAEGAYVFITGRREAELNAAVKDIGKNIKALKGDVSNLGDLDRILSVIKQAGSISSSPMPASRNMRRSARSPKSSTTPSSTSM
jgi:NAD(P)-dependent dehydrogenase (short-subunit alcohol dehydrogenase family)